MMMMMMMVMMMRRRTTTTTTTTKTIVMVCQTIEQNWADLFCLIYAHFKKKQDLVACRELMSRGVGYDFKSSGGPTEITYLQSVIICRYYLSPIFFLRTILWSLQPPCRSHCPKFEVARSFLRCGTIFLGIFRKKWDGTIQKKIAVYPAVGSESWVN